MLTVYVSGLMLGLSLITALGPQNIFLIRQGALRNHAALSMIICFFCDAILIVASIAGLHELITLRPMLHHWMTWFGAAFLFFYGFRALKQSFGKQITAAVSVKNTSNRKQIVMLALGFSLLNPHAIIDSLVIIGGGSAQYPDDQKSFLLGVLSASLLWFSSLTWTTYYFSEALSRATIWRWVEFGGGVIMLCFGLKLAITG